MEKVIVDVAWCDRNFGILLVVMYQERWFLQHQPLKLCKKKQRKVWSFMLEALWKMGKMYPNG